MRFVRTGLGFARTELKEARMTFTVTSNSFKDGDYLGQGFHPVGRFRLRLRRRQQVAASQMVGRAGRHQEFRRHLLRPRCADRLRLLALAGGEHPGQRHASLRSAPAVPAAKCRQARYRRAPISARPAMAARARRKATTRTAICSRCSRSPPTSCRCRPTPRRGGRLQSAFRHAGQGGDHGAVQALAPRWPRICARLGAREPGRRRCHA